MVYAAAASKARSAPPPPPPPLPPPPSTRLQHQTNSLLLAELQKTVCCVLGLCRRRRGAALLPVHSVFLTLSVSDAFYGARVARSTRRWTQQHPPARRLGVSLLGPAGVSAGPRTEAALPLPIFQSRARESCESARAKGQGCTLWPWHFGRWFCVARSLCRCAPR